MGNCMRSGSNNVSENLTGDELIMVMRMDGEIMEFTAPFLAGDLTAAYPRHSLVHSGDLCCSLSPDYKLLPGKLYCLLPFPNSPSQFSNPNNHQGDTVSYTPKAIDNGSFVGRIGGEGHENTALSSGKPVQNGSGIIRVKIVITKQELEAFLSDCSMKGTSMEQVWLEVESKAQHIKEDYATRRRDGVWRPSLESIPEIN